MYKTFPQLKSKSTISYATKILLLLLVLSGHNVKATVTSVFTTELQAIEINGIVTDSKGQPIPGATIMEKGTDNGTSTNINGEYKIRVTDANAKLIFSFTGFISQEKGIGNISQINVELIEDNKNLSEVVIVGYGSQKKATVTGSVSRANLEAFRDAPNTNIGQSLQGAVPGLNVGPVTAAGNTPTIRVRGRNSLNGNQNALIILDGIQFNASLSSINPDDIESIDILKDASSTAVYGAQAANGVILITSRKGKGEPRVNFNTSYATQTPSGNIRPMTRAEELDYVKALDFTKSYTNPAYVQPDIVVIADGGVKNANGLLPNDFDWYKAGTKTGFINDYGVSIAGGAERMNYLLSANYTNQAGFVMNDLFKRKSIRSNVEGKVNNWLTVGIQAFGAFNNQDGAEPDIASLLRTSPLLVPYDANGNLIVQPYSTSQDINPFSTSNIEDYDRQNYYFANLYTQVNFPFLEGLSYRLNFGNNGRTINQYRANPFAASQTGVVSKSTQQYYDYTLDNIISYVHKIKDHNFNATLVYGAIERRNESTTANATGFSRLNLGYNNLGAGTIQTVNSGGYQESLNYQMARLNYTFKDRYIFTGTARRDGFSGFAENYKYAIFPSVSLGWIVTDEPFFKSEAIQYLKLRAGYGTSGNQVGRYESLDQVGSVGYTYIFDDGNSSTLFGQRPTNLGNPNLRWEKTDEINLGADFTLLKGRLTGTLDVYSRRTRDLLFNVNIPNITGFTSITSNIGNVTNKGLELTLTSMNIKSGDFKWNTTFNFSRNINRVTDLLGSGDLIASNLFIGQPISAIYNYKYNGIYGLNETIPAGYYPGTRRVIDVNNDGVVNTNDRVIIGDTEPAYRFSFLNSFQYKDFSLSVFINSIQGGVNGYLGNNTQSLILNDNNIRWNNVAGIDWWSPTNPDGEYPRSQVAPTINPGYFKSRSFVRLQDVTLKYNIAQSLTRKLHFKSANIFISGKNLITLTKWKGWDPEIADGGLNRDGRPLLKGYSVGLNITL